VNEELRQLVWSRAEARCEYCRLPAAFDQEGTGIDHIRARSHGGPTNADNLCLACFWCNTYKGTNPGGYDPETEALTPLFNPRQHRWADHFVVDEASGEILGQSDLGRTTAYVLRLNTPDRCQLRREIFGEGVSW